eukprot:2167401-Rhodomonas_salina.4
MLWSISGRFVRELYAIWRISGRSVPERGSTPSRRVVVESKPDNVIWACVQTVLRVQPFAFDFAAERGSGPGLVGLRWTASKPGRSIRWLSTGFSIGAYAG